jgi:hypothetical protein
MFLAYLLVKAVLGTIGCGATIYLPISGSIISWENLPEKLINMPSSLNFL